MFLIINRVEALPVFITIITSYDTQSYIFFYLVLLICLFHLKIILLKNRFYDKDRPKNSSFSPQKSLYICTYLFFTPPGFIFQNTAYIIFFLTPYQ